MKFYSFLLVILLTSISTVTVLSENKTKFSSFQTGSANNSTESRSIRYSADNLNCVDDKDCPPWAKCNSSKCVCNVKIAKALYVQCNKDTIRLLVRRCHCVTFNNETGEIVSGLCIENCVFKNDGEILTSPPLNVSQLNHFMCEERWNRTGRLCGRCLPGHSPLAYSYDMRCVKCPEGNRNIWKYFLVAFGPLTVFYCFVLLFKINATSSHLHGYIIFAQILSIPHFYRIATTYSEVSQNKAEVPLNIFAAIFGIWNLDFFRGLYPDICLDVSTLTVLALDYGVAIYPLLLTVVSYILIELHARNFRLVVILWRPFHYLFLFARKNWDSKTTVIDAFATFFLLSFTKIGWVSSDLLITAKVHFMNTTTVTMFVPYYDATLDYFGRQHLPYAILALFFCLVLVILPVLLLILYPFKWFQKLLNHTKFRTQFLTALMDSFQGCYKDGTEHGTRDCRWFAAVPLIGRIGLLVAYIAKLQESLVSLAIVIIVIIIIATTTIQPYKKRFDRCFKIDLFFWGMLAMFFNSQDCYSYAAFKIPQQVVFTEIFSLITAVIPLLYMMIVTIYWVLSRMRKLKTLINRIRVWRSGYENIENEPYEIFPDRVVNPEHYQGESLPIRK